MRLLLALALSTSFACATSARAPAENAVAREAAIQQRENAIATAELKREAFIADARRSLQQLEARIREAGDNGGLAEKKTELALAILSASQELGAPLEKSQQKIRASLFELDRQCAMVESGQLASN